MSIDFIDGTGGGLKIDNPNAPPKVRQLSAPELKAMLDRGEVIVFDVRPEDERVIARIAAARPLDAAGQKYLFGLDRETPVVFHCHLGMRSQEAGEQLRREGFRNVYNLKGGIDAWSQMVDPLGAAILKRGGHVSSHPTDFQGSVIDALREAIERKIPGSRADVNGGGGHFAIEVTSPAFAGRSMLESQRMVYGAIAHLMKGDAPPVHAVDSLNTRTPSTS